MPSVSHCEMVAAIHDDLVLPVMQYPSDDPHPVPPDLPEGGLVLDADTVTHGQLAEAVATFVEGVLHLADQFGCEDFLLLSLHHKVFLKLIKISYCWEETSEVSSHQGLSDGSTSIGVNSNGSNSTGLNVDWQ